MAGNTLSDGKSSCSLRVTSGRALFSLKEELTLFRGG